MESIGLKAKAVDPGAAPGYVLINEIGQGNFGTVYKAQQISTGQFVAIKFLKFRDSADTQKRWQNLARFEREIQICAEINHPHIVGLLDKGYTSSMEPFAVFEYVSGITLKELIVQNCGLPAPEAGELMGQVLDALICAHAKGIVHRDLKPHNIMVTRTGTRSHVKVLDFGIGAFTHNTQTIDYKNLTLTHEVLGTPTYCSPEQLRGEPPTVKSDLYAWGLILIECLTGKPVMRESSVAEVFQQQLNPANIPLPVSISGHPLAALLRRVLHKDPSIRAGSAEMIFEEYSKINFNTIVGILQELPLSSSSGTHSITSVNHLECRKTQGEKKQITVLAVKVSLSFSREFIWDIETVDVIQKDQLNLCKDTAVRFGGYIAGSLTDNLLIYFGYPHVHDNDARRAGRTALELIGQIKRRSALLNKQNGIELNIRIGMNSGTVLCHPNQPPEGMVPNCAFSLLYCAEPGSILVSEITKKLLDPYLEFENSASVGLYSSSEPVQTYRILGERQSESLSFLRPWSADRKLVGRAAEQKRILDLWDGTASGKGKAILVQGPAGIGKSKLIYESKKQVLNKGYKIRECRCLPEHQNDALYAISEMLNRHLNLFDTKDNSIKLHKLESVLKSKGLDIHPYMPILCSWLNIPSEDKYIFPNIAPARQKELLFEALQKLILQGDKGRFLWVVEDLHWIDPTSLEFLAEIIQSVDQANFLLLMTARPEFTYEGLTGYVETLTLNTLTRSSVKELSESTLNHLPIDEKTLDYIVRKTDGVPLFIEELISLLLEKNYLILKDEVYHLLENISEKQIPVTLNDLLNSRLDKLGFAKETAQVAATIGREFNYDLLVKASLRDEAMVQNDLEMLLHADLIYRRRNVQSENYVFRHALIRDAAYEGMMKTTREQSHLKIAHILESEIATSDSVSTVELEILAIHLFEGKRVSEAIDRLLQAAENTRKQSVNRETVALCRKALNWIKQVNSTDEEKKKELLIRKILLSALMATDGYGSDAVGRELDSLQDLCIELEDKAQLFSTICIKVNYELCRNNWMAATRSAHYFHEESLKQTQSKWIIASSLMLGQQYFLDAKFKEASQLLEKVLELYDPKQHRPLTYEFGIDQGILAASILCSLYYFLGRLDEIPGLEEMAITWAQELNHEHTSCSLYYGLCCSYFYKGDKNSVKKYYNELTRICQDTSDNMFLQMSKTLNFWADNDLENLKQSIAAQEAIGIAPMRTFWYTLIASLEIEMKNYRAAEDCILKALAFVGKSDGHLYECELRQLLGQCYLGLKQDNKGKKILEEAKRTALQQGATELALKVDKILNPIESLS